MCYHSTTVSPTTVVNTLLNCVGENPQYVLTVPINANRLNNDININNLNPMALISI